MAERTWPENAKPTAEQLADWLVAIPREERIERAEVILDAMDRADACFLQDHASLLDRLAAAEAKVGRAGNLLRRAELQDKGSISCDFNGNRWETPIMQADLRAALSNDRGDA